MPNIAVQTSLRVMYPISGFRLPCRAGIDRFIFCDSMQTARFQPGL